MKTAARRGGYIGFFLVCTLLFVYWTFPTERARSFAEIQLAHQLGAESVEIGKLSLAGLGGVTLRDMTVRLRPLTVPTEDPAHTTLGPDRIIMVSRLAVSAGLGALTGGSVDVGFEADLQGGTVRHGRYAQEVDGEGQVQHVVRLGEIRDVALGSEQMFQALFGKDIVGQLSGSLDLSVPMHVDAAGRRGVRFDGVRGRVNLMIRDAELKGPLFPTPMGTLRFSDADLGDITLEVVVDRGTELEAFEATARRRGGEDTIAHIAEGRVEGDDLAVELARNSAITIRPGVPLAQSQVNIQMAVQVKDAYIDKRIPDPRDPERTSQPNTVIRMAMGEPPLRQAMENGVFGVSITGTLGNPQVSIGRPVVRSAAMAPARRPNIAGFGDDDDDDDDDAPAAGRPSPQATPPPAQIRPNPVRAPRQPDDPRAVGRPGADRPTMPAVQPPVTRPAPVARPQPMMQPSSPPNRVVRPNIAFEPTEFEPVDEELDGEPVDEVYYDEAYDAPHEGGEEYEGEHLDEGHQEGYDY